MREGVAGRKLFETGCQLVGGGVLHHHRAGPARRAGQGPQPERIALVAVRFGEVTVTRPATAEVAALRAINDTQQGNTEKLKNPFDPDSLAWYAWIVARMGGWSGYTSKGYRPAEPKTMARGLKRLDVMVAGWTLRNRSALTGLP